MTLHYDRVDRRHLLGGTRVRSVTQMLDKVRAVYFGPEGIWLDEARTRGKVVHQACALINEGAPPYGRLDWPHFVESCTAQGHADYLGYVTSWVRLLESGRLQAVLVEHVIASFAPRFCGCVDWIGTLDGVGAILDFSTGDAGAACKSLQTAAYSIGARAWAQMPGEDALRAFYDAHTYTRRFAVELQADGTLPKLHPYSDPRDLTTWLTIAHAVNAVDALRPASFDDPWRLDEERHAE
jgi:hypothetical protein